MNMKISINNFDEFASYLIDTENKSLDLIISDEVSLTKYLEFYINSILIVQEVNSIQLFLLDSETYTFEHYIGLPKFDDLLIDELVPNIEVISTAITTMQMQYIKNSGNEGSLKLLIPLVSFQKIIGLFYLETTIDEVTITLHLYSLLTSLFHKIGIAIDYLQFKQESNSVKQNYQQLLAINQIETQKVTLELQDTINQLTKNLSMMIPHEIRTPINQILGSTKMLKDYAQVLPEEDREGVEELVDDIASSVNRLRRISENYIFYSNLTIIAYDISKLSSASNEFSLSPKSVIYDIINDRLQQNNTQDRLIINLIDTPIKINESFLVKIIEEAIDNAIKFSSPISTINVNSSLEGNKYVLSIKNYGVGMSESDVETIQPFLQFQRSVQEQQGMGLGLAIIFRVMSIFGGSAEINSKKEEFFELILKFQLSDVSVEDFLQS